MHLTSGDTASVTAVLGTLDAQASVGGATSNMAGVWRDWADLLRPTAELQDGEPITDRALLIVIESVTPQRVA
jgi:hypothetical protein